MASIKIETGKSKNAKGNITGYWAKLGDLGGCGDTPEEAVRNLEARVREACTHEGPKIFVYAGIVAVLTRDLYGWSYRLIEPGTKDGPVYSSVCCRNQKDAERSVRMSIAQRLYPDPRCYGVIEDEQQQKDFASWARFQESYKQLRSQGMSDTEAHQKACGL
jgi:hypothetical protein